ncbi:MAG: hypothetical protein H8E12_20810 [Rhodobacteraceae bacterium]|nr:hypothetical protein [Paracoccaceae bacterium]
MKYGELSGYDKFILMSDQASGLPSTLTSYIAYQQVEKILELCERSDASTIFWDGKDVEKPIRRGEAGKVIESLAKNKFDHRIFKIARLMGVELRV